MTHSEFLKKVGVEMKVARIRKDMAASEIAKLTGLNVGSIISLEKGEKDSHILTYKRIADVLNIDIIKFFIFDE